MGRRLIDAGADLIIGHHSHTVQPFEIYKGKYIFYSLGNFVFQIIGLMENFIRCRKERKITNVVDVQFTRITII
ncbi:MAG: CapA family protein [Bacteroidales bacterium]